MKNSFYYIGIVVVAALVVFGTLPKSAQETDTIKKFASYEELESFIKTRSEDYMAYRSLGGADMRTESLTAGAPIMADSSAKAVDYSSTNMQVEGVDEADIIKNDGKYIYAVSNNKILIIDAYPAEGMKIVSEINLNKTNLHDIFVNGNRLVVFGSSYDYSVPLTGNGAEKMLYPYPVSQYTFANIYDISDRARPVLAHNISAGGYYITSRMIDGYVYMIINEPVTQDMPVPALRGSASFPDIYYFDVPGSSYNYINIVAIDINAGTAVNKAFLVPYSENVYVSKDNIYITYTKWLDYRDFFDKFVDELIIPAFPELSGRIAEIRSYKLGKTAQLAEIQETIESHLSTLNPEQAAAAQKTAQEKMIDFQTEIAKERERTVVHKISISGMDVSYVAQGSVPGRPLNQFSMDEHKGNFRIATTVDSGFFGGPVIMTASAVTEDMGMVKSEPSSAMPVPGTDTPEMIVEEDSMPSPTIIPPRSNSVNNLYVLDANMNIVGKLEDLAPGERIYSARFMGQRAYIVTFRQVDPLFVVDLSSPSEPKVLGQLKITGVSQYIHPVNDTHIIGIGKEATEEGFFMGLKMSLFDVSDVSNPKESAKFTIGDRGTDSQVLHDHKAFLYSPEKDLLVLPVMVAEIDWSKYPQGATWAYGEPKWQGTYAFSVKNGLKVLGRVSHATNETESYEYYYGQYTVSRSLFMDDVLYTMSNKMLKANSLSAFDDISSVELPGYDYGPIMSMESTMERPMP